MTLLYLGHLLRPVPLTAPAQFYGPRLSQLGGPRARLGADPMKTKGNGNG